MLSIYREYMWSIMHPRRDDFGLSLIAQTGYMPFILLRSGFFIAAGFFCKKIYRRRESWAFDNSGKVEKKYREKQGWNDKKPKIGFAVPF